MSEEYRNPFVGPTAIEIGAPFYGREVEVKEIFDALIADRIVLLYSPSGAGKTSLIQAGLIPLMDSEGFDIKPVIRLKLSSNDERLSYIENPYVRSALVSLLNEATIAEMNSSAEGDYVRLLTKAFFKDNKSDEPTFVIFDQFEEIFVSNVSNPRYVREFLEILGTIFWENKELWGLFSLREEFVGAIDKYAPHFPNHLVTRYLLEFLNSEKAKDAIKKTSLEIVNAVVGESFAQNIISELSTVKQLVFRNGKKRNEETNSQFVEPMHLQIVCRKIWGDHKFIDCTISRDSKIKSATIDEALEEYYDYCINKISKQKKYDIDIGNLRAWIELSLITSSGVRGQVIEYGKKTALIIPDAINDLVDYHIIRREVRRGVSWLELAHDRLIKPIRISNKQWKIRNSNYLIDLAEKWKNKQYSENYLISYKKLKILLKENANIKKYPDVGKTVGQYIKACKTKNNRIVIYKSLFGVLVCFLTILSYLYYLNIQNEIELQGLIKEKDEAISHAMKATLSKMDAIQREKLANKALYINSRIFKAEQKEKYHKDDEAAGRCLKNAEHMAKEINDTKNSYLVYDKIIKLIQKDYFCHVFDLFNGDVVVDVALSKDSRYLAAILKDEASVLEFVEFKLDNEQTKKVYDVTKVKLDFDASKVVFAQDNRFAVIGVDAIQLYQIEPVFEKYQEIQGFFKNIVRPLFFGKGDLWTVRNENKSKQGGMVSFYNISTDNKFKTNVTLLEGEEIDFLNVSKDGGIFAVVTKRSFGHSSQSTVYLFNSLNGKFKLFSEVKFSSLVRSIEFNKNSQIVATVSDDKIVRLFKIDRMPNELDIDDKIPIISANGSDRFRYKANSLDIPASILRFTSDDSHIIIGDNQGGIIYWNVKKEVDSIKNGEKTSIELINNKDNIISIKGHKSDIHAVELSRSGKNLLSFDANNQLRIWEMTARKLFKAIEYGPKDTWVRQVGFLDDNRIISLNSRQGMAVWRLGKERVAKIEEIEKEGIRYFEILDKDSKVVTVNIDKEISLYHSKDLSPIATVNSTHGDRITSLAYERSRNLLFTGSNDNTVKIWSISEDSIIQAGNPIEYEDSVSKVIVNDKHGVLLSLLGNGEIHSWNYEEQVADRSFAIKDVAGIRDLILSKNKEFLATTSNNGRISIWRNKKIPEVITSFRGHEGQINTINFGPHDDFIVSAGDDKTLRVWDLRFLFQPGLKDDVIAKKLELFPIILSGHRGRILSSGVSPSGDLLVSSDDKNSIISWNIGSNYLIENLDSLLLGKTITESKGNGQLNVSNELVWENVRSELIREASFSYVEDSSEISDFTR